MPRPWLELDRLTFCYDLAAEPVLSEQSLRLETGWTGVIGPNGSGKTTLLRLAAGELTPTAGAVRAPDEVVYLPQRTDDPPPGLPALLRSPAAADQRLAARLGLAEDWPERWATLSHGERKRAQIAVALAAGPSLLAVDEPTNHLDEPARKIVGDALAGFRGVGLLVSHDRDLLDRLCTRCLYFEPGGLVLRTGGYTAAVDQAAAEREAGRRALEDGRREVRRLRREVDRRKGEVAGSGGRLSKRKVGRKDHDAKAKIDAARLAGMDTAAAARKRALESRLSREEERLAGTEAGRERRLGVTLPGERSRRAFLLRRPAGDLPLGGGRGLRHPALEVRPEDRVGISGPNGAGKSSLLRALLGGADLPEERIVHLPQEIDERTGRRVHERVRALPRADRGQVFTVVSRLGSDPERLLETESPSPGELRKLLLALGLSRTPWLLVMDEPTNHLDLPSVECLEAALADFPGALLLVSHDRRFLSALAGVHWEVAPAAEALQYDLTLGRSPKERS